MSNYSLLRSTSHFNLWGLLSGNSISTTVRVYINYREPGKHFYPVWEHSFPANLETPVFEQEGFKQANTVLNKFECLWPCTFLAKEYIRGGLK